MRSPPVHWSCQSQPFLAFGETAAGWVGYKKECNQGGRRRRLRSLGVTLLRYLSRENRRLTTGRFRAICVDRCQHQPDTNAKTKTPEQSH